jgi:hypothetical protein
MDEADLLGDGQKARVAIVGALTVGSERRLVVDRYAVDVDYGVEDRINKMFQRNWIPAFAGMTLDGK